MLFSPKRTARLFLPMLAMLGLLAGCFWQETETAPDYLMMDDSVYPYAGLPRVVIETEDFREIRDRETEFDAYFQIYGETEAETAPMPLTVRGRGNSSFKMPKYGMKLEFTDKVSLLGMPKNRDWALIANFGDKTHLRNYMMYRLSDWLQVRYAPRCTFVELYLNRKYMGLYLLSETVKVAKDRVNMAEGDSAFLFEKESDKKIDSPYITTKGGNTFHVKSPKNASEKSLELLRTHLNEFEDFLNFGVNRNRFMHEWVDIDDFVRYYWVQEFAKNEDANFSRSIFMTWQVGGTIHFGPLWDFDLGFGNASREPNSPPEDWYVRRYRWFYYIVHSDQVKPAVEDFWAAHHDKFRELIDSVPLYRGIIEKAIDNEYRRWPVLQNTENWALKDPYETYDEAVSAMVDWMRKRYDWINSNFR